MALQCCTVVVEEGARFGEQPLLLAFCRRAPARGFSTYAEHSAQNALMAGMPLFAHAGREKLTPPPLPVPIETNQAFRL